MLSTNGSGPEREDASRRRLARMPASKGPKERNGLQRAVNLDDLDSALDERDISRLEKRSLGSVRRDRLFGRGCPWVKFNGSVRYLRSDYEKYISSLPRFGSNNRETHER